MIPSSILSQTGFTRVTESMANVGCSIVSVVAENGQGKTHWSLNAPGPIAYYDLDRGLHRALKQFTSRGKEIYAKSYALPPNMTEESQTECFKICTQFQKDYRILATRNSGIRTLVVDTGTDLWELTRLAFLGKLTQVPPYKYALCNSTMSSIIARCRQEKINLLILHKVKTEYVNEKSTGKLIRHGWSEMGYQVDAEIFLTRDKKTKMFQAEYWKAGSNPDLVGEVFSGEAASYPRMMARMFNDPVAKWTDPVTGIVEKKDSEAVVAKSPARVLVKPAASAPAAPGVKPKTPPPPEKKV